MGSKKIKIDIDGQAFESEGLRITAMATVKFDLAEVNPFLAMMGMEGDAWGEAVTSRFPIWGLTKVTPEGMDHGEAKASGGLFANLLIAHGADGFMEGLYQALGNYYSLAEMVNEVEWPDAEDE